MRLPVKASIQPTLDLGWCVVRTLHEEQLRRVRCTERFSASAYPYLDGNGVVASEAEDAHRWAAQEIAIRIALAAATDLGGKDRRLCIMARIIVPCVHTCNCAFRVPAFMATTDENSGSARTLCVCDDAEGVPVWGGGA